MSLARTLLFFITMALIATLALLLDGVALFAQSARGSEPQTTQQPAPQSAPQATPPQATPPQSGSQSAPQPSAPQQSAPQQPAPDAFRFKSSVELINVSATVVDSLERFVPNLHKEDFVLYEDDNKQAITHFSDERVPVSLGILLDTSGSMEGEKFRHATDAIERFMRELLDPDDEVFLFTFNDQPRMLQGWTKDRDLLMRQLRRAYPAGGTAMYDTVAEAIPYAQRGHNRKKAIVIISDGNDNKSTTAVAELRSLIRETEVLLYAIGIDGGESSHTNYNTGGGRGRPWPGRPGTGRWPQQTPSTQYQQFQPLPPAQPQLQPFQQVTPAQLPLRQTPMPHLELAQIQWPIPGGGRRPPPGPGFPPQWPQPQPKTPPPGTPQPQRPVVMNDGVNSHALRELTDDSGGRTEIVRDIADLDPATASIANELSRQYSLAYEPAAPKDGRWHTIRLEAKNRDYKVRARKGYMATP